MKFSFGVKKDEEKPSSAPAFSFGVKKDDEKPSSAPSFSFGVKKDDEKPSSAPAFSFGVKKDDEKPSTTPAFTFTFGAKKDGENSASSAPKFTFPSIPIQIPTVNSTPSQEPSAAPSNQDDDETLGQEGVNVLFKVRAKLLKLDNETKNWNNEGVGFFRIEEFQ